MPVDESYYEQKRRATNYNYSQQAATNALGRFVSQQRGDRGIQDYTQQYKRGAPSYTAGYAKRGLAGSGVQSGVYGRAMQNYTADYGQGLNRMYADQQTEANQYDLNTANYGAQRDQALADIELDKQREIANAAAYLSALKGQFS